MHHIPHLLPAWWQDHRHYPGDILLQVFNEYGGVILYVLIASMCLLMYAHIWYGSAGEDYDEMSMLSRAAHEVFKKSTSDATRTNVESSQPFHSEMYITNPDGTSYKVSDKTVTLSQDGTANKSQDIAGRYNPKLFSYGTQNQKNGTNNDQLLVDTAYNTTDLFWAEEYDANGNKTGEIHTTSKNSGKTTSKYNNYKDNEVWNDGKDQSVKGEVFADGKVNGGFMRVLSVSKANGDELISDCSKIRQESIAFANLSYDDKTGGSGSGSYTDSNGFHIKAEDGSDWLSFNVNTQTWNFRKSGTYCVRVFVVDSKGKSATNTMYISIAPNITKNEGPGYAGEHD